jgi:hypothetical protein
MFTQQDIRPLSIAAAGAVVAGLGFGAWASPPPSARPPPPVEPQVIVGDDPNLAAYKEMIAAWGGSSPPPYVVPVSAPPETTTAAYVDDGEARALEAELDRQAAAFEEQERRWEAERVAWLDARRREWRDEPRPYAFAYAAPAAAPRPEPQPPPPPVPEGFQTISPGLQ